MKRIYFVCVSVILVFSAACVSNTPNVNKPDKALSTPNQFEQNFLAEVNKIRARPRNCGNKKYPAAPALVLNEKLTRASYKHSLDMSNNQFLEHVSSNGDTLVERMQGVAYSWSAVGENIAHNQKSILAVLQDWLVSPGHCSNLMSADYSQTGVAVVNRYWTQVYASPKP